MKHTDAQKQSQSSTTRSPQPFFGGRVQREPFFQPSRVGKVLQAKLTVGAVGDVYEQEADLVATEVVDRIHSPAVESGGEQAQVQRMGEEKEELQGKRTTMEIQRVGKLEEEKLKRQPLLQPKRERVQRLVKEDDELKMKPSLQRVGAEGGEVSEEFEGELNRARGGGQPLATELQTQMGEAMGADFSGVRVHTDGRADTLNQSVGARAFTTKQDLFFKRGEYQPGSRRGQELIAHELTHFVQQGEGTTKENGRRQQQQHLLSHNGNDLGEKERPRTNSGEHKNAQTSTDQNYQEAMVKRKDHLVKGTRDEMVQREKPKSDVFNIVGEEHDDYTDYKRDKDLGIRKDEKEEVGGKKRESRDEEKELCREKLRGNYWREGDFVYEQKAEDGAKMDLFGDPPILRAIQFIKSWNLEKEALDWYAECKYEELGLKDVEEGGPYLETIIKGRQSLYEQLIRNIDRQVAEDEANALGATIKPVTAEMRETINEQTDAVLESIKQIPEMVRSWKTIKDERVTKAERLRTRLKSLIKTFKVVREEAYKMAHERKKGYGIDVTEIETWDEGDVRVARSRKMHEAATVAAKAGETGVWKVGDKHVEDILTLRELKRITDVGYVISTRKEFIDWKAEQSMTSPTMGTGAIASP